VECAKLTEVSFLIWSKSQDHHPRKVTCKLKIVFDGFWWREGPISNRTVMVEFIEAWSTSYPEDKIFVVTTWGSKIESYRNITFISLPRIPHPIFNLMFLSLIARFLKTDAVVAHNFPAIHKKSGVFIHDFIFIDHPQWFSGTERAYFSLMKPLNNFFAKLVFTSSKTEASRIRMSLQVPISVCPLGVRSSLKSTIGVPPPALQQTTEGFYLTVGRNNPRKNIDALLQAYCNSSKIAALPKMVVVGSLDEESLQRLDGFCNQNRILVIPKVTDSELAWLYQNTSLFVFPSLDEGFGMPILEALYFNSKMLLSDIEVFHEVSQGIALFVNSKSLLELSQALINAQEDKQRFPQVNMELNVFGWLNAVHGMRSAIIEFG
jgi:glycosyltransferase involved in cell wall biosynthesis